MSTLIRVRDGVAHISTGLGTPQGAPFLTAIVEASGALLHWDPTAGVASPDADIDDVAAASGWLADIYGAAVSDAVRAGGDAAAVDVDPDDPRLVDAVLRLGHLAWARAWWPAGARIPALDPALLAAEVAVASHTVSHLLDDDDAVERALQDAADAGTALAALSEVLAAEGAELSGALAELADDHGVDLLPATTRRAEWALAAGGAGPSPAGIEVASGTAPIRWTDVPAQTVDAEGEARWSLRQRGGGTTLRVEVPAVDRATTESLRARFGPGDTAVEVALARVADRFEGEAVVVASLVFLPAHERTLWVRDPVLAPSPGAPESADDRERTLQFATLRLHAPHASLAERAAGAAR
ncbi:hypothetical protein [Microbacterium sp. EST19A]|uniref:hypothetical protein n=1 Tax=Microbacterium sp. EST19A TaxID=2862681 RepID=UPI001CC0E896|nr:hypothetical protein [Microbacterium sp. EST19A]